MVKDMVIVKSLLKNTFLEAILKRELKKDLELQSLTMENDMRENGTALIKQDMVSIIIQMVTDMKENGIRTKKKVMESFIIKVEQDMKDK